MSRESQMGALTLHHLAMEQYTLLAMTLFERLLQSLLSLILLAVLGMTTLLQLNIAI